MKDSEIGEIWQQCRDGNWKGSHAGDRCIDLIRKLVKDRADLYKAEYKNMWSGQPWHMNHPPHFEHEALHDFGIPVEEWKE